MKIATGEKENLTRQITVKVTESQYQAIQSTAKEYNRHPSEFMRMAIMEQIEQLRERKSKWG